MGILSELVQIYLGTLEIIKTFDDYNILWKEGLKLLSDEMC